MGVRVGAGWNLPLLTKVLAAPLLIWSLYGRAEALPFRKRSHFVRLERLCRSAHISEARCRAPCLVLGCGGDGFCGGSFGAAVFAGVADGFVFGLEVVKFEVA